MFCGFWTQNSRSMVFVISVWNCSICVIEDVCLEISSAYSTVVQPGHRQPDAAHAYLMLSLKPHTSFPKPETASRIHETQLWIQTTWQQSILDDYIILCSRIADMVLPMVLTSKNSCWNLLRVWAATGNESLVLLSSSADMWLETHRGSVFIWGMSKQLFIVEQQ